MTNAIEVTKREMFDRLAKVKKENARVAGPKYQMAGLESAIEYHLEALRQEIEGLRGDVKSAEHEVERQRVALNVAGDELRRAQSLNRSYARQLAGTQESPALMTVLGALVDAQRIMTDWLVPDGVRARDTVKALLPVLDNQVLVLAMREFEQPKTGE